MDRDTERKAGKAMTLGMCVFSLLFALFWCALVYSMGAWFMLIPGVLFVGITAYRLVICLKLSREDKEKQQKKPNAPDPWDRPQSPSSSLPPQEGTRFCPYCGASLEPQFVFCPKCGRRL